MEYKSRVAVEYTSRIEGEMIKKPKVIEAKQSLTIKQKQQKQLITKYTVYNVVKIITHLQVIHYVYTLYQSVVPLVKKTDH